MVSYGRHFSRTVYTFSNIKSLLANGIAQEAEGIPEEDMAAKYVVILF
jgi:hypothetical protein